MNEEGIKAYIIDLENLPERTSKDRIRILHVGLMADDNMRIEGLRLYEAENLTKMEKGSMDYKSDIQIWKNRSGDLIASCNCPARKICKHIIEAAKVHRIALTAGFIKE